MKSWIEVYDRYRLLSQRCVEKYRKRICAADPRVGMDTAFYLAHNWGNDAARVELTRYNNVSSKIIERGRRETDRSYKENL
jgi:hypothetical protein